MTKIKGYEKFAVGLLGFVVQVLNAVALPDNLKPYGAVVIAIATAFGVKQATNTQLDEKGGAELHTIVLIVIMVILILWAFGAVPR